MKPLCDKMVANETNWSDYMDNRSLGKLISVIMRHQRIVFDYRFEKYGFGSGQYLFFLTVAKNEGSNQREISKKLKVNKATTNKAMKKLEEIGYIEIRIDKKDRRLHRVYLSEEGKRILPKVRNELKEYTEMLGAGFDEQTKEIVFDALEQMASNVKTRVDQIREEKRL